LKHAERLRAQAAEAREVAFLIERGDMRARMLDVAAQWDLKADQLEQLARSLAPARTPS